METTKNKLLQRLANPFFQAAVVLTIIIVVQIGASFASSAGVTMKPDKPWVLSATFILFFAIFNSILSLLSDNMDRYRNRSMLAFAVVAGIAGLLAWAFSGLSINEAGSFRWIYIVLSFGYLLFLSMISAMRKIVEFAQREEWNQPKIRQGKRRW